MNNPITLVHITDLHFFSRGLSLSHFLSKRFLGYFNWIMNRSKKFDFSLTEGFLAQIEKEKPKAVIITGDFSVTSDVREFEKAREFVDRIKATGVSVYLIPGNHDYYTFESVRKKQFEKFFGGYLVSDEYPVVVKLNDNLTIVFLNTVKPNLLSSRGAISQKEIEELEKILASGTAPMIVSAHYPVLHKTETYYSNITRRLGNSKLLRRALIKSKVPLLYIAGHVHHYSYTVDKENPLVAYLTTPPLFYRREFNGGYTEINFNGEKFSVKLIAFFE